MSSEDNESVRQILEWKKAGYTIEKLLGGEKTPYVMSTEIAPAIETETLLETETDTEMLLETEIETATETPL